LPTHPTSKADETFHPFDQIQCAIHSESIIRSNEFRKDGTLHAQPVLHLGEPARSGDSFRLLPLPTREGLLIAVESIILVVHVDLLTAVPGGTGGGRCRFRRLQRCGSGTQRAPSPPAC
jgi:hypothetical protein